MSWLQKTYGLSSHQRVEFLELFIEAARDNLLADLTAYMTEEDIQAITKFAKDYPNDAHAIQEWVAKRFQGDSEILKKATESVDKTLDAFSKALATQSVPAQLTHRPS